MSIYTKYNYFTVKYELVKERLTRAEAENYCQNKFNGNLLMDNIDTTKDRKFKTLHK